MWSSAGGRLARRTALVAVALTVVGTSARAQESDATISASSSEGPRNLGGERGVSGELYRMIRDVIGSMTSGTRGKLLDFFETIEVWDAEAEIDRLVGSPWVLHDSTDYKLRLLPLRLAFPVYGRLTDLVTGLDDRRGLRIQNLGVDEVDQMAVTFQAADDLQVQDFARSLLGQFSVREFSDLAVFGLSHQGFFPQTEEGWKDLEHRLARNKGVLVGSVLGIGALFNAGAFSTSGGIAGDRRTPFGLGWYGGIRRLGRELAPQLRGGLTARAPGLELALGLREQLRPGSTEMRRWAELAMREGWLSRLSRPNGWDAFFEGALRRVLSAGPGYEGEHTTGRLGIFARRESTPRFHHLVFRTAAELETDLRESARFVLGFGFEHPRSGLATLLQTSRTAILVGGARTHESRGGLFVAGTVEPPSRFAVDRMHADARAVREEWEALAGPDREQHLAQLAAALAAYLESRRVAYSLLRWQRPPGDLHGPLEPDLLLAAGRKVTVRFQALAASLEELAARLAATSRRADELRDFIQRESADDPRLARSYQSELDAIDKVRHREAERAGETLAAYHYFRETLARMAAATPLADGAELDPVPQDKLRLIAALSTPSLL